MEIQNFTTVCRLCLGESVFLSVLDESFTSLPQKILACVDVEVRETDRMTKMICKQCFLKIEDWHDFKKSCEQSQFKLQTWANNSPDSLPSFMNVTIKEEQPDDEMQIMENEVMLNIKIEPSECDVEQDYDHLEAPQLSPQFPPDLSDPLMTDSLLVPSSECDVSSHGIEAPPERCRVCSKMFSTIHNRIRHERDLHHLDIDSPRASNSDLDSVNNINNYSDASSDATQMTSVTQASGRVSRGNRVSKVSKVSRVGVPVKNGKLPMQTEAEFINYYVNMNQMIKLRHCLCCNIKYNTNKKLYQHLRKRMYLEYYACYPCWISFPNISQFKIHSGNKTECHKRAKLIKSGELNCKLYQNYKCNYCLFIFPNEIGIKNHMEKKHNIVNLPTSCPTCSCVLDTNESFQDHLYSNCIFRVYCGICKKDFPTNEDFDAHTSVHDGEGRTSNNEAELRLLNPASFARQHSCHLCDNKYNNNLSLLKHLRLYHNDPSVYICKICPDNSQSRFMLRANLTDHMMSSHKETSVINLDQHNNFSCNACGSLFTNLNEWKKHQKMHLMKHRCDECNERFDTPGALEKHKSSHKLKLKLYRCSENSYVTSAGRSSRRNSFVNQLMCRICDKYFSTKSELHDHLMLHDTMPRLDNSEAEETGGYQCELCDKNYKFKFSLVKHIKNIHGEKSLSRARAKSQPPESTYQKMSANQSRVCVICDIVLNNSNALYKHNHKYHSKKQKEKSVSMPRLDLESEDAPETKKDKTFTCDICDLIFMTPVGLSNHTRSHERRSEDREINPPKRAKRNSTPKPIDDTPAEPQQYKCISCEEVYPDLESLQQHILVHITPEMIPDGVNARKIYPCVYCLKICITPPSLSNHMKIHDLVAMKKAQKKCQTCGKIVANNAALVNHLKSNNCGKVLKKAKKHLCNVCNKIFPSKQSLLGHMRQHAVRHAKDIGIGNKKAINPMVKKKSKEKVVEENEMNAYTFNCSKCDIQFSNTHELQQHVRLHVREVKQRLNIDPSEEINEDEIVEADSSLADKFHCDLCDEFFVSPHSYKSHKGWHKRAGTKQALLAANSPKIKYNCTSCKLFFDTESDFHKHERKHGKKYFCEQCNKEYTLINGLRKHMQSAHNMQYQAEVSMEIVVPESVKKVDPPKVKPEKRKSSSQPQNYKCTECNTFYPNAKRLRQHVMTHANATI